MLAVELFCQFIGGVTEIDNSRCQIFMTYHKVIVHPFAALSDKAAFSCQWIRQQ